MLETLPQVGDVIESPKFAYGYFETADRTIVTVDGETTEHLVGFTRSEEERVQIASKIGTAPSKTDVIDLGAYDPSRGTARFVVENARMQGGGFGHGPHDIYPDGWHVKARRLTEDGTYDPNGELIHFYMTGAFTCLIEAEDVRIVGRMQQQFV